MQNHYNLIYREEEREMFPTLKVSMTPICAKDFFLKKNFQHLGVGAIPWSPLARGLLARPFGNDGTLRSQSDGYVDILDLGSHTFL